MEDRSGGDQAAAPGTGDNPNGTTLFDRVGNTVENRPRNEEGSDNTREVVPGPHTNPEGDPNGKIIRLSIIDYRNYSS